MKNKKLGLEDTKKRLAKEIEKKTAPMVGRK